MGSIFDILGPVMVGPSSSHTAGAARIGYTARQLFGESVKKVEVYLHGSFAATGKGHGTDRAIIAGLLGMKPDDLRIPVAFEEAKKVGMEFTIANKELKNAHPNTSRVIMEMLMEEGWLFRHILSAAVGSVLAILTELKSISVEKVIR